MTYEIPDRDAIDLSAVLHALSDPQRRGIVAELAASEEPRPCGSFAPGTTTSPRAPHLRVLREAGLVEQWKEGTSKMSRLRREDIDARFPGLLDSVLGTPVAAGCAPPETNPRRTPR